MNFLTLVIKKPLSLAAIFFFWLPLLGILMAGIRYWYISLGAFVLMCMIAGTQRDRITSRRVAESERIDAMVMGITRQRIALLKKLGQPEEHGDWAPWQRGIWNQIHTLDREEEVLKGHTEVINLEPFGHHVGRNWKR